jgi:hypothetical protein
MFKKSILALFMFLFTTSSVTADSIITGSKPFTFTPGTTISSSQVNADYDYIINQVNTNAAKNGANSSITSLLGLTTPINVASGGTAIWTATTIGGTANAITVTATTPVISSYSLTKGNIISLQVTAANTGAVTLNVNSLGVKTVFKPTYSGLVNLTGGELQVNQVYLVYYDGTNYILINLPPLFGGVTVFAAAASVDPALAPGHVMTFTSGTPATITSFGTNASSSSRIYIAYNNTSSPITIVPDGSTLLTPDGNPVIMNGGDMVILSFFGTGWNVLSHIVGVQAFSVGTANGLTITNNTGTPNTQIDVTTTGRSILETTAGGIVSVGAQTLTINAATTGINALDTGSLANNTWYYVYLISNGTTTASLLSTSSTAPTMPTGYVYKYRIGAVRTGGAATFLRTIQKGNRAQYQVIAASTTPNLPAMATGTAGNPGTPTWVSVSTSNFVPTTATSISGVVNLPVVTGSIIVAPNNAYGARGSATNPPAIDIEASATGMVVPFTFVLESSNIFWASSGSANNGLFASGWVDAVNAN